MIYTNPNVRASDRTGYVIASFICDTFAELPAQNYLSGYTLEMGSTAHVIETSTDYTMKSDGTWISQTPADVSFLVTEISDIETRLTNTETDAQSALNYIAELKSGAISALINQGAKNVLDMTPATTTTDNGVTFTVNPDYTITLTGSAIAPNNAWFIIPVTIPAGTYIFSGMPVDGGTGTYRQELRIAPRGGVTAVNDLAIGNVFTLATDYTGYYHIRVASGYDFGVGVTVKPMIDLEIYHEITNKYVPYAPTNKQLFDIVRGL